MSGSGNGIRKFYCAVPCLLLLAALSSFPCASAAPTAEQSAIIAEQTKLLEANPKDYKAYFRRGRAYFEARQFSEAESDFKKGIEINPNSQAHWLGLAYVYEEQGLLKRSIDCIRQAQKIGPLTANLGAMELSCLEGLDRHEECITTASKLIQLFPDSADLYYWRAIARSARKGERQLIGEDFRAAVRLAPTNERYRKRLERFSASTTP